MNCGASLHAPTKSERKTKPVWYVHLEMEPRGQKFEHDDLMRVLTFFGIDLDAHDPDAFDGDDVVWKLDDISVVAMAQRIKTNEHWKYMRENAPRRREWMAMTMIAHKIIDSTNRMTIPAHKARSEVRVYDDCGDGTCTQMLCIRKVY